ncbi:MAG: ABC transporter substrate-binding protein, partial [Desulfohalobiaceae bacterium]
MKKILVLTIMMGLLLTAGCGKEEEEVAEAPKEPILIGLLSDLSGGTADVGVPYAEGVKAAGEYINANGGIDGRQVKLLQVDYAYNVQQALAAYKKFKNQGIVALQGWGTGDTEALTQFVAKDEIPTFSASYSAHLTDPKIAPYNFFTATDYSTQARAGLKYIMESWNGEGAPRLALVYPDHPYGLSPIKAIKEYAQELGFELVGEEIVGLSAMDAATQLLSLQKKEPDFVWVGGTTQSTAVVMKDAQKLGMDVVFLTNIWGTDENIFKLAGDVADKHLSLQTSVVYGQDVPGMEFIEELTDGEPQVVHYIRG